MSYSNEESPADFYIKKAEEMVVYDHGGGKNDKHWHRDVNQVARMLWKLDDNKQKQAEIRNTRQVIQPSPYTNFSDQLKDLEKEYKQVRRRLDARGESHSIRGKGSSNRR